MRLPGGPARFLKTRYVVAAFVLAAIVAACATGFAWANKRVTVYVDGDAHRQTTFSSDVASLLKEAGVDYSASDLVSPPPGAPVTDGGVVVVRHAVPVNLQMAGETTRTDVVGTTVADALVAAGLDPASGLECDPPVDEPLSPNMTIKATDVFIRVSEEQAAVPYDVVVVGDPSKAVGSRTVTKRGASGRTMNIYQALVVGGVEGPRTLKAQKVLSEPVAEVVSIGTKKPFKQVMAASKKATRPRPPTPAIVGTKRKMVATAYTPWDPGCSGIKAIASRKARYHVPDGWGIVAVDPKVIPLGSKLFVDGYGYGIAADTGGAIKGDKIDVCFWGADLNASTSSAGSAQRSAAHRAVSRWGRRTVNVTVLGG